jgi:hypothetical protein
VTANRLHHRQEHRHLQTLVARREKAAGRRAQHPVVRFDDSGFSDFGWLSAVGAVTGLGPRCAAPRTVGF